MNLNLLTLEASKNAKVPPGVKPFRYDVHHVKEIFTHFLPKIDLNNSSKIEIAFGPQGNEAKFDGILGVTNYFVEDFDFKSFYEKSTSEQEKIILDTIVNVLKDIADRKNNNASTTIQIIENTAQKVLEAGFHLEIPIEKLSKKTPDKKISVQIFRCLNAEVGESWRCDISYLQDNKVSKAFMSANPDYIDKRDLFFKSKITNHDYIVVNKFSKVIYETVLGKVKN